ncbi:MAG: ferrous iron transport protein B [Candidatus Methanomethyliaceae archaeon]|nr:ferrous iron transport protein B [Candidatus Methanomethyliaceae archaeon]MDW7971388.1 ferrous iron transport protein B [Nitrososphaerota archaeon]
MKSSDVVIALVGNPNVGKSTLFNNLTGLNQTIGNWPGKTVEVARGTLVYENKKIEIIDLPGTYSLTSYSEEEVITRDYILSNEADVIINVVDATALERNLFLTLQLMEMNAPLIIALNMVDEATKKGLEIKVDELEKILEVPIIPIIATSGAGVAELIRASLSKPKKTKRLKYGKEIEDYISKVIDLLKDVYKEQYPIEWVAIKVLEGDPIITAKIEDKIIRKIKLIIEEMEKIHGEPSSVIIASERYSLIHRIINNTVKLHAAPKISLSERIDGIITHPTIGYLILVITFLSIFSIIFSLGGIISEELNILFESIINYLRAMLSNIDPILLHLLLNGILLGIGAGISIIIPYVFLFYLLLSILEDTGYLPRAAFLLDSFMHKIGLHGKAFIPILLAYGCSVPACMGCRIMETWRERLILGATIILIPCSARTVIILGLVGHYVGILAALMIFIIDIIIVVTLAKILFKLLPGRAVGLIMEIPPIRMFKLSSIIKKTWIKTKDFIYIAFPLIVAGSLIISTAEIYGLIDPIVSAISPITVGLLGLPLETGIAFIFGFLRKELALIMLATYLGSMDFSIFMNSTQMIIFAIVMTLYIPCIATLSALIKEFGWKRALMIAAMNISLALIVGSIGIRILNFLTH